MRITFKLKTTQLFFINAKDRRVLKLAFFTVIVGGKQSGFSSSADVYTTGILQGRLELIEGHCILGNNKWKG